MEIGDIVFVTENSVISKVIRFFDKGKFSHIAIFVSESEILEAEYDTKVRVKEFDYSKYEIISLNLSEDQKELVKSLATKFCGRKYDFLEIINIWLRIMFGFTELNKFNSPKEVICSELVAYFLEDLKIAEKGAELLSPNELYKYLKDRGY